MTHTASAVRMEPAHFDDGTWIRALLANERQYTGSIDWWRFITRSATFHARAVREYWYVVRPRRAFVHWRVRADGVRVVDSLAVAPGSRHLGLGRALLAHVGRPLELRVLPGDRRANDFALACGLQPMVKLRSARGREFILYRGS